MSSSSWLNLTRKTAIVTGAASGIGKSIARAFYDQGCNVILADHKNPDVLEVARDDIIKSRSRSRSSNNHMDAEQGKGGGMGAGTNTGTGIEYIVCDVTDKSQVRNLMAEADQFHTDCSIRNRNRIDMNMNMNIDMVDGGGECASILVNAAGITRDGLMNDITEEAYDSVLDVNLKGTFLSCQAFCDPSRIEALCGAGGGGGGGGSIINIGSVISERGNIGQANYAASKGGVVGLTRALAKELAFLSSRTASTSTTNSKGGLRRGGEDNSGGKVGMIRVNAILPGFIHTPMTENLPETIRERLLRQIPLRRFGSPEDVANMAMFLASQDRSGYVTGECWECSGAISI